MTSPLSKEQARELVSEVSDCPRCGSENHAIQAALLAFIDEQINALISANARVAELERDAARRDRAQKAAPTEEPGNAEAIRAALPASTGDTQSNSGATGADTK